MIEYNQTTLHLSAQSSFSLYTKQVEHIQPLLTGLLGVQQRLKRGTLCIEKAVVIRQFFFHCANVVYLRAIVASNNTAHLMGEVYCFGFSPPRAFCHVDSCCV